MVAHDDSTSADGTGADGRRDFLKRGAAATGTLVWAVPVVQALDLQTAAALAGSPKEPPDTTVPDTTVPKKIGSLNGLVVDASTGDPLEGAVVSLGSLTRLTDALGAYEFADVPAGSQTVSAAAAGYITSTSTVLISGDEKATLNFALAPEGPIRAVLAWNTADSDLDLHVSGPDGGGGRFHVAFYDQNPVEHASLDLDDTTFEGPETVTISISTLEGDYVAGLYSVWVHDYPTGVEAGDFDLTAATVTLYDGSSQVAQYQVTAATGDSTEEIWRVVDFTVDDAGVISGITPLQSFADGTETSEF